MCDDAGQSLILVTIAMALIIAVAAFSIAVAQWNVGRHKAQVTADATALAAANCLASGVCESTSPGGDAEQAGDDIANRNGFPTSAVTIAITSTAVNVTIKTTVASSFAGFFGMPSKTVSGSAVASYTPPSSGSCSTPGNSCAAVFAMGQSCSSSGTDPGGSPIIFGGFGDTIKGTVHSNGSIYEAGGGQQTLGPTTFGNGSGCAVDWSNESGDTWNGSSTRPTTGEPPITSWPDDYTQVVTPCGSGYSATCGSAGTPSYCTKSAANWTFGNGETTLVSGQVWCAYGTGTKSNPNTWNGDVYFQSGSTSTAVPGNWIGGSIELGENGFTLTPQQGTFPTLYATGASGSPTTDCTKNKVSSSGWVCMDGGNEQVTGAIFAPTGTIEFDGGGSGATDGFLEAQDIYFDGGSSIIGDGPTSISGGPSTPGSDSLTG